MMERKELIDNFLKQFKISLTNAGVYFKDHPFFRKSTQSFRESIDAIILKRDIFSLGVTSQSLMVEGEYLDEERAHSELAHYLHCRKIKKIIITRGITLDEVIEFLTVIAMPLRDLMKAGGVQTILEKRGVVRIAVEELDYSQILGTARGDEAKDIWKYLIEGVSSGTHSEKEVESLLDNFEVMVQGFNSDDLRQNPAIIRKIGTVLMKFRDTDPEKYAVCSKMFVKFLLREAESLNEKEVREAAKDFFENLDAETLGQAMWEYNFKNKRLDAPTLEVFSRLLSMDKQKEVASCLGRECSRNAQIFHDHQTRTRLEELVSSFDNYFISDEYRQTLAHFLKEVGTEGVLIFNEDENKGSYIALLVNILAAEDNFVIAQKIIDQYLKQWDELISRGDITSLTYFLQILREKETKVSVDQERDYYRDQVDKITGSFELFLFDSLDSLTDEQFASVLGLIKTATLSVQEYITLVVSKKKSPQRAMIMFFTFFPEYSSVLFKTLKEKITVEQARVIAHGLRSIDRPGSLALLKQLYSVGDETVKIEVLEAMQHLSSIDEEFLLKNIKARNVLQRREALRALKKGSLESKNSAMTLLLDIFNLLGLRNNFLIQNIRLVEEEGFKEALPFLAPLSKKRFFWWHTPVTGAARKAVHTLGGEKESSKAGQRAVVSNTEKHA